MLLWDSSDWHWVVWSAGISGSANNKTAYHDVVIIIVVSPKQASDNPTNNSYNYRTKTRMDKSNVETTPTKH